LPRDFFFLIEPPNSQEPGGYVFKRLGLLHWLN
jgi:hypothetical protein